ncbi:MAG TPA: thiamine phosphate synthase [Planctomycetes bacterium]|nr:thiamine phosphate synthase [Planctomycetota bacterium]HIK59583.1 thiamine phosphate synthase [Planctomycetota bacterium]
MSPILPPRLLALSPGDLMLGEGWVARKAELLERVRAAWRGGLRGVLLREPELPDGAFSELAVDLVAILDEGWVGLHDRPHLVRAVGAQGVHLGFRSVSAQAARQCVGGDTAVGVSTHAGDSPTSWEGADYLFHGPVFPPLSKSVHLDPVGPGGLQEFVDTAGVPVWGLGGLTPERASVVIDAGAVGVACLGGLLSDADPERASALFAEGVAL